MMIFFPHGQKMVSSLSTQSKLDLNICVKKKTSFHYSKTFQAPKQQHQQ